MLGRLEDESRRKITVCCDMVCIMQDIAYRLIFKLDIVKINLFDVALVDDQGPLMIMTSMP